MQSTRFQLATCLAMLAVSLQIVIAAVGGSVCVSPRSAPVGVSPCAATCCDEVVDADQILERVIAANGEAGPIESECCVEVDIDLLAEASSLRQFDPHQLVVFDVGTSVQPASVLLTVRTRVGPTNSAPPPDLVFIRSTVLRI